jgi:peptidoglycan-associated lipoprotein
MNLRSALRTGAAVAIAASLVVGVGCKKPPPPETPVAPPPPPAPPPEPARVPEPVVQMVKNFQRVYFEFDSATLTADSKEALTENVAIMQKSTDIKIELQGHADERGTTDYNLALGQRRAEAVKRYMTAQGIGGSRLTVISYGEERPLDGRSSESAWTKNRRAEFRITWGDGVNGTTN